MGPKVGEGEEVLVICEVGEGDGVLVEGVGIEEGEGVLEGDETPVVTTDGREVSRMAGEVPVTARV